MGYPLSSTFQKSAALLALFLPLGLTGCLEDKAPTVPSGDNTEVVPKDTPLVEPVTPPVANPTPVPKELSYVTRDTYDDKVNDFDGPVLLNFSTDWCPPCRPLKLVLKDLQQDWVEGRIYIADGDVVGKPDYEGTELRDIYDTHLPTEVSGQENPVIGYPSMILLNADKDVIGILRGLRAEEEIKSWIEETLKNPEVSAVNDKVVPAPRPKLGL